MARNVLNLRFAVLDQTMPVVITKCEPATSVGSRLTFKHGGRAFCATVSQSERGPVVRDHIREIVQATRYDRNLRAVSDTTHTFLAALLLAEVRARGMRLD